VLEIGHEKKNVLVADDNKSFLMYMAILLRRMGLNVLLAENGVEALKLIKQIQPDLVFLDCLMPKLDGMSVLRCIRADHESAGISIVMMSSNPKTLHASEKFESCGLLPKPVQIEHLHENLQNCIFKPMGCVRRHLRIPFNERVSVTFDNTRHDLFAESLSEGGIYIRIKEPYPVSAQLDISLTLRGGTTLDFQGKVIYIKGIYADLFRVPPGMAIEFQNMRPENVELLKLYIKEYLAADIWENQKDTYIGKNIVPA
jgi:CheY-like chemotaxis protein